MQKPQNKSKSKKRTKSKRTKLKKNRSMVDVVVPELPVVVPELPVDVVALLFNAVVMNDEDTTTPKNWLNMILVSKTWHRIGTRQSVKDMVGIITTFNHDVSVHDDCNSIGCSCDWRRTNQGQVYNATVRTIRYPSYLRLEAFVVANRCFFARYDLDGNRTDGRTGCIRVWNGGCDVTQIGMFILVDRFFPT